MLIGLTFQSDSTIRIALQRFGSVVLLLSAFWSLDVMILLEGNRV